MDCACLCRSARLRNSTETSRMESEAGMASFSEQVDSGMKETSKGDILEEQEVCISLICLYILGNSISESRNIPLDRPIA